jgi:hypothetical protein
LTKSVNFVEALPVVLTEIGRGVTKETGLVVAGTGLVVAGTGLVVAGLVVAGTGLVVAGTGLVVAGTGLFGLGAETSTIKNNITFLRCLCIYYALYVNFPRCLALYGHILGNERNNFMYFFELNFCARPDSVGLSLERKFLSTGLHRAHGY